MQFPIDDISFLKELIPQREPFIMVDRMLYFDDKEIAAGLLVTDDNIFSTANNFTESGIVEHMAQTIALHTGYSFFLKGEPAPMGYIGAIKNLEIYELPEIGDIVNSTATILQEFMGVTLMDVVTKVGDKQIAVAKMKTVIASDKSTDN